MINTRKSIEFQSVGPGDFGEILRLEKSSFNEYDMMNSDDLAWYYKEHGNGFYKILDSGNFAGYIMFFIEDGEGYMESIAIDGNYRGRGLADNAIEFMIQKLTEEGIPVLKLHVRKENAAAIALYRKHGFKEAGTEDGVYADGAQAYVYIRSLQ